MNEPSQIFMHQVKGLLEVIANVCAQWGCPELAEHMTLVLRDPDDPDRSQLYTTDRLNEVIAVLQYLRDEGVREGDEDAP